MTITKSAYLLITLVLFSLPLAAQDDHHHHDDQAKTDNELTQEDRWLLHEIRVTNSPFHDVEVAVEAGYGEFLSCFTYGTEMGMGQHYVSGELVSDAVVDPLRPESLVYEPGPDGRLTLVGLEYLVFADVWDPEGTGREAPTLFGQDFMLESNIPDTPPVWAFHLWLYTHNPNGLFAHFNPTVFCPAEADNVDMSNS